jgi:hypothetical protein
MKPQDLAGIHDILPLRASAGGWFGDWAPWILLSMVVLVILASVWRWFHPLNRLQRALQKGRMPPRRVAHELARTVELPASLKRRLDELRFARHSPDAESLQALIDQSRNAR